MLKSYHIKFLICRFDFRTHSFHIIVYSIQHSPLVNDHTLQFAEDIRQLDDALCDVVDLAFSLFYGSVVLTGAALRGLHERGLGEGLVCVGFHQGWICIWILLHGGWSAVEW